MLADFTTNYFYTILDGNGKEISFKDNKQCNIMIDEDIVIYPNPAYDNFTLEIESVSESPEDIKFHVTIFDLLGNPKANFLVNAYDEINISQLTSGIYMVSITLSTNQKVTKPLIKLN